MKATNTSYSYEDPFYESPFYTVEVPKPNPNNDYFIEIHNSDHVSEHRQKHEDFRLNRLTLISFSEVEQGSAYPFSFPVDIEGNPLPPPVDDGSVETSSLIPTVKHGCVVEDEISSESEVEVKGLTNFVIEGESNLGKVEEESNTGKAKCCNKKCRKVALVGTLVALATVSVSLMVASACLLLGDNSGGNNNNP